jgi:hypothetical protein
MPIILGQKDAKCPVCGGTVFTQVPTGKVTFLVRGSDVQIDFKQKGLAFLCATVDCNLRTWTMEDMKAQEAEGKRIIPND